MVGPRSLLYRIYLTQTTANLTKQKANAFLVGGGGAPFILVHHVDPICIIIIVEYMHVYRSQPYSYDRMSSMDAYYMYIINYVEYT